MNVQTKLLAVLAAAVVAFVTAAQAGDWPHWRGPAWDGSSKEGALPDRWSATQNIAWQVNLPGPSASTPIIVGKRIFLSSTQRDSDDLLAVCLQASDGRELWRKVLTSGGKVPSNTHTSCSPVADAQRVCYLFGTGVIVALDHDGKELWRYDIAAEYGSIRLKFGYSASPALIDGRLIVSVIRGGGTGKLPGGEAVELDSFVLALDAESGKKLWRHVRKTDASGESQQSYSSPIPFIGAKGPRGVLVGGGDYLTCHAIDTGNELWRVRYVDRKQMMYRLVPSPTVAAERVVGSVPRGRGVFAVQPPTGAQGAAVAWTYTGPNPDVCSPLYYRSRLYVLDGRKRQVTCLDPADKGKVLWEVQLPGSGVFRASPTGADGKIYCIDMGGKAFTLAAGDTARLIATSDLPARELQASIAAAAGALFVRTEKTLYCIRAGAAVSRKKRP